MKDIIILYKGGSGGFFIYYYLLASDSNVVSKIAHIELGKRKKLLDACFYDQFRLKKNLNYWKNTEKWPTNQKMIHNDNRNIFLCCNGLTDGVDPAKSIVLNPYINGKKKWLRIQVTKRCMQFADFPKKHYRRKEFFNFYKNVYKQLGENSKFENADYFFDFIKFLQDKNERKKLCDFLDIKINTRMENYLEHYIRCHGDFYSKLIK